MVKQLDHKEWAVRWTTVKVLQTWWRLSDEILKAVVQRLDDEDSNVRRAALEVLRMQSSLSDEILTAVAGLLGSKSERNLAEVVLRKHENFYSTLLSGPSVGSLFKILLRRAFAEQWSWYIEDRKSCVNMPDGIRSNRIDNMEEFMDLIIKARPPDTPPMAGM